MIWVFSRFAVLSNTFSGSEGPCTEARACQNDKWNENLQKCCLQLLLEHLILARYGSLDCALPGIFITAMHGLYQQIVVRLTFMSQ